MKLYRFIPIGLLFVASCSTPEKPSNFRFYNNITTPTIADSAMVVAAHPLASAVGVSVLKDGGNAVDAAVAVQFALAVVYPIAGNIGGGGFMIYRDAAGTFDALDYREMAPSTAHRDMYLGEDGKAIPGLSRNGHLAAGIPGTVDGMWEAHSKYGHLPWSRLVQPAIDLANNGFILTKREASLLNEYRAGFDTLNTIPPAILTREKFEEGDSMYMPDLAQTFQAIRDNGRSGFYEGRTADLLVAEMKRGNGIITHEDLFQYKSVWRSPISGQYKDYRFVSMCPPSSGGIALIQLLEMVEPHDLKTLGWNTTATIHIMAEAERRVYADRTIHLGDPDFWNVPQAGLTDSAYIMERMGDFNPSRASSSDDISEGNPIKESEQTTHFSIVDQFGNAVSITTTLNGAYGSKVMVDGAGFFLNNEMDDFAAAPNAPNLYGLLGSEANAVAPGKRMLSSMTPTIVEKGGELNMVLGTPGGATIITSVFQTFLNVAEHDMTMQEAVSALKFHHQWRPDSIRIEDGAITVEDSFALAEMGHRFWLRESIGKVDAIRVLDNGTLEGGADPRGDDKAMGF